ncbi:hypothetical protein CHH59_13060 [Shouchella clausii]|nr:hypothetical protein CHH59_13060 [Shouchella clausii]
MNINHYPPYKRLVVCLIVTSLVIIVFNTDFTKESNGEKGNLPNDLVIVEGFVVSKRMNSIWVADQPINATQRLLGLFTSDYGSGSIEVTKHPEATQQEMFNQLQINQEVRVYSENIRESNPPTTSAYWIEVIDNS